MKKPSKTFGEEGKFFPLRRRGRFFPLGLNPYDPDTGWMPSGIRPRLSRLHGVPEGSLLRIFMKELVHQAKEILLKLLKVHLGESCLADQITGDKLRIRTKGSPEGWDVVFQILCDKRGRIIDRGFQEATFGTSVYWEEKATGIHLNWDWKDGILSEPDPAEIDNLAEWILNRLPIPEGAGYREEVEIG